MPADIVVRVGDAVYRRGDAVTLRPLGTLWEHSGKIIKNHEGVWCLLVGEFSAPLHCFDCEVMKVVDASP